jgi:hypothetical protein
MTKEMDEAIERLVRKRLPPGAEAVSVRVNDGLPQRGFLLRTREPFPPLVRELKAPNGQTLKIQVLSSADGYVLVTWGHGEATD